MSLENELISVLKSEGADLVKFVDISALPKKRNKKYPIAILIGIKLSPPYLQKISNTPHYVEKMKQNGRIKNDEFHLKEIKTDWLADYTADYLISKGYSAYSQSEDNIIKTGYYDNKKQKTPLPHKTIALMAGIGWIGKHNLLVNHEFGSAVSMCTVLTNAPLETVLHSPSESQCGNCNICIEICTTEALKGKTWYVGTPREDIVDVSLCTTCIECLVQCPWTQAYMKRNLIE